jgi:hypothetical protein
MERSKSNNHACFIYDTFDEYLTFTSTFIEEGIKLDEQMLCIADRRRHARLLDVLAETVDVEYYLRRNQLQLCTSDDFYMAGGVFKPVRTLRQLLQATTHSASQSFSGFRVCGDMTWALRLGELTALIDYEASVNAVLPTTCVAVCQYDRRQFQRDALVDVSMLHHHIRTDARFIVNPFYQTASNLLLAFK